MGVPDRGTAVPAEPGVWGWTAGRDEACDDGNATAGDGCSSCRVDPGFACTGWGPGSCTPTTLPPACPNSKVEAGETCDDGNATASDGCSATCQLEAGWTCPQPGAACEKNEYCGDGVLNGTRGVRRRKSPGRGLLRRYLHARAELSVRHPESGARSAAPGLLVDRGVWRREGRPR